MQINKEESVMEKKYFTPDTEDIRVGYECESLWCCQEPRPWLPIIVTQDDNMDTKSLPIEEIYSRIQNGEIRVPYLTKEQIEAEGWNWLPEGKMYKKNEHVLIFSPFGNSKIEIRHLGHPGYQLTSFFLGECKDINTFRFICKLLNI